MFLCIHWYRKHNQAGISKQEWVHWMFLTGPGMDLVLLDCPGQVPMGTRQSNTKNGGWVVAKRRCLNSLTILCKHPPWSDRSYHIVASRMLHPLAKWGQHGSVESCSVLENGPTCSLVSKACSVDRLQYMNIALLEENIADEAMTGVCKPCCRLQWHLKLIKMIAAMYMSSAANKLWVITQEFCTVGG